MTGSTPPQGGTVPDQADRNLSPHTTAATPAPTAWTQFGRHRFRAPIGIVIDTPFPIAGGWVAVIWPDAADPSGWRRLIWEQDTTAGRGWLIPERLAYADVIEFGSDPTGARRWYGIVQKYEPGQWLTVQGPFPTPVEAGRAADQLLNPTQHVPEQPVVSHDRARRDRCHTRAQRPRL
jgi:hypothetical protein